MNKKQLLERVLFEAEEGDDDAPKKLMKMSTKLGIGGAIGGGAVGATGGAIGGSAIGGLTGYIMYKRAISKEMEKRGLDPLDPNPEVQEKIRLLKNHLKDKYLSRGFGYGALAGFGAGGALGATGGGIAGHIVGKSMFGDK